MNAHTIAGAPDHHRSGFHTRLAHVRHADGLLVHHFLLLLRRFLVCLPHHRRGTVSRPSLLCLLPGLTMPWSGLPLGDQGHVDRHLLLPGHWCRRYTTSPQCRSVCVTWSCGPNPACAACRSGGSNPLRFAGVLQGPVASVLRLPPRRWAHDDRRNCGPLPGRQCRGTSTFIVWSCVRVLCAILHANVRAGQRRPKRNSPRHERSLCAASDFDAHRLLS